LTDYDFADLGEMMRRKKILILDDENEIVQIITGEIGNECDIRHFKVGADFLDFIESDQFEPRNTFAFVDIVLDEDDQGGFKAIAELNAVGIYMPTIFVSYSSQEEDIQRAAEIGSYAFLNKNRLIDHPGDLRAALAQAEGAYIHRLKDKIGELNKWGNRAIVLVGSLEHEIGNLTTPIVNSALTLRERSKSATSVSSEMVEEMSQYIISAVDDVKRLLAHTFKFVKGEEGGLIATRTDIIALTKKIASRSTYQGRALTISSNVNEFFVDLDEMKYTQIIANLLSNAIRYGGVGGITVELKADESHVDVSVRDFGPVHLSRREVRRLWAPLERGDPVEPATGGGLGLTIVWQFAEMHGGSSYHAVPSDGQGGNIFGVILPKRQGA
jgi:signal transduction histidine kinase